MCVCILNRARERFLKLVAASAIGVPASHTPGSNSRRYMMRRSFVNLWIFDEPLFFLLLLAGRLFLRAFSLSLRLFDGRSEMFSSESQRATTFFTNVFFSFLYTHTHIFFLSLKRGGDLEENSWKERERSLTLFRHHVPFGLAHFFFFLWCATARLSRGYVRRRRIYIYIGLLIYDVHPFFFIQGEKKRRSYTFVESKYIKELDEWIDSLLFSFLFRRVHILSNCCDTSIPLSRIEPFCYSILFCFFLTCAGDLWNGVQSLCVT